MPTGYDDPPLRRGRSPLEELMHRLTRAVESGRRIQLSPTELDWFAVCGGLKAISDASTNEIVERAKARLLAHGEDLRFLDTPPPEGRHAEEKPPITPIPPGTSTPEMEDPGPFSTTTLAMRWRVSPGVVYSRIKSGKLPHFRIGTLYRIRYQDVLDYERTHHARMSLLPKL